MSETPANIGPYRILDLLGEGGMGVVYAAEQRVPLHRRVALKVIKVGMDTKEVLARFEVERQALAMLDHPNIARVLDAGSTETGRPYFAMELVRGLPINRYCDVNRLTVAERVALVMQAAAGLQHAHDRGILHRDVKPSNLLVTDIDGRPHVKIIDFGLAKATNQRLTERTVFTEEGRIIGTPEYMSPEQAEMSALNVDHRTDVYSLGVVLYELVSGALPFDAHMLRQKGYLEIQRIIREEDPPTPSKRISQLRAEITAILATRRCGEGQLFDSLRSGLDAATMVAIAKNRNERYPSCRELAQDLQAVLEGDGARVAKGRRRSALVRQGKRFVRRNAASIVVGLGVACVAAGLWWFTRPDTERGDSYREMLAERDQRIRELSGDVARMREKVDEVTALAKLGGAKVAEDDPGRTSKLLLGRDAWGAAAPHPARLASRATKALLLTTLQANPESFAAWTKQRQDAALAAQLGDIEFHFVVSRDGVIAEGRAPAWAAHLHGASEDAIAVCLLLANGTECDADQAASLRRLVLSLERDGLVERSAIRVDRQAGQPAELLSVLHTRFAAAPGNVPGPTMADVIDMPRKAWATTVSDASALDPMERITKLTLHHSAMYFRDETESAVAAQVQLIEREHREKRGYGDIGYHFLVDAAGRVIEGRSLAFVGAHASGEHNRENVGICLLGNFALGKNGQAPTQAQLAATEKLLDTLRKRYDIAPQDCYMHSDFKQTECPGPLAAPWFREYVKQAKESGK